MKLLNYDYEMSDKDKLMMDYAIKEAKEEGIDWETLSLDEKRKRFFAVLDNVIKQLEKKEENE